MLPLTRSPLNTGSALDSLNPLPPPGPDVLVFAPLTFLRDVDATLVNIENEETDLVLSV